MGDYQVCTTNVEIELGSESYQICYGWKDLVQDHCGNGFTMYFCCCVCFIFFAFSLIGSLLIMCGHVAHILASLVVQTNHT